MDKLIAIYPILYQSHQYDVGDELPANDQDMVNAWLEAGTAKWQEEQELSAKAKSVTAQSGLTGTVIGSEIDGNDLVGVVPKTPSRSRKK